MESVLQKLKSNIEEYGVKEMKYTIEIMRGCMNSIIEPFTFVRPLLLHFHLKVPFYPFKRIYKVQEWDIEGVQKRRPQWKKT